MTEWHSTTVRAAWARPAAAAILAALAVAAWMVRPVTATAPSYTALGDSYSSGVGTRTYYADGTSCERSPLAYPVLDAARLGAALTFAACANAQTSDVLAGQLGSLGPGTADVTISIGGNDIGWSHVLERCALPWPFTCWGDIDSADAFITGTLPGRLDAVYARIRALAPNARVVVVGYPRLFDGQQCNLLTRISPGEQTALNHSADLLAATTSARAAAHGFRFVDARPAFTGHVVCDNPEWVNGLSDPVSESYHPNPAGQAEYADLVLAALTS